MGGALFFVSGSMRDLQGDSALNLKVVGQVAAGNYYSACSQEYTIGTTAGINILALDNPAASGKNIYIKKAKLSLTAAYKGFFQQNLGTVSGGDGTISPTPHRAGGAAGVAEVVGFIGTTSVSVPASPRNLFPAHQGAHTPDEWDADETVIIPPGYCFNIEIEATTTTSSKGRAAIIYREETI